MILNVYLPEGESHQFLAGSAIVADPNRNAHQTALCYLEGNLYRMPELDRYEARLLHAAGRCITRYPTVALIRLPLVDLLKVGHYETDHWQFHAEAAHLERLSAWTDEPWFVHTVSSEDGKSIQITSNYSAGDRENILASIEAWGRQIGALRYANAKRYLHLPRGLGRHLPTNFQTCIEKMSDRDLFLLGHSTHQH